MKNESIKAKTESVMTALNKNLFTDELPGNHNKKIVPSENVDSANM